MVKVSGLRAPTSGNGRALVLVGLLVLVAGAVWYVLSHLK
jgi:hypothetical protein